MEDPVKSPRRGVKFQGPSSNLHLEVRATKDFSHSNSRKQSAKSLGNPSPKVLKELDKKYEDMNYFSLVEALRAQLVTKQHHYHLKAYPNTLLGSEITAWLISSAYAPDMMEAEFLANALVGHGHIYDLVNEDAEEFDSSSLFRFSVDDRISFHVDAVDLDPVELTLSRLAKKKETVVNDMTYREVFVGSDAVDLIMQKGTVTTRDDAVKICERMLGLGILIPVGGSFDDDNPTQFRTESDYMLRDRDRMERERKTDTIPAPLQLNFGEEERSSSKGFRDMFAAGMGGEGTGDAVSVRNLFASMSPRKQQAQGTATSPLTKAKSRSDTMSPRQSTLNRQHARAGRSPRGEEDNIEITFCEAEREEGFDGCEAEIKPRSSRPTGLSIKNKDEVSAPISLTSSTVKQVVQEGIVVDTPNYLKALDEKFKGINYMQLADLLRTQAPPTEHMRGSKAYSDTLLGSEIIDWLIASETARTNTEAEYVGGKLITNGHIHNVWDAEDEEFARSKLYRFMGRKIGLTSPRAQMLSSDNQFEDRAIPSRVEATTTREGAERGDLEVRSMRNLFVPLSPRKLAATTIASPRSRMMNDISVSSPRKKSQSRQPLNLADEGPGDDLVKIESSSHLDPSGGSKEFNAGMMLPSPRKKSSVKGPSAPPTLKDLDKKYKEMNYFVLMDSLRSQLPTKHHLHRLKTYPNTVLGSEITNWMIVSGYAPTVFEAQYLANEMIGHGHIYDVLDEDSMEFDVERDQIFRFSVDDRIQFNIDSVNLDQVEAFLFRSLKTKNVDIKDITYKDVFCGSDAIELVILKGMVTSRADAVTVCQRMLDNDVFVVVQTPNNKNEFFDESDCLYVMRDQNRQAGKAESKPTPLDLGESGETLDESQVTSLRNVFANMSPRKQGGGSLIAPLQRMASKKGMLSPRSLSRQRDQTSKNKRADNADAQSPTEGQYKDKDYSRGTSLASPKKDASTNTQIMSQKFFEELEAKHKNTDFGRAVELLKAEVATNIHTRNLKTYPDTLQGSEITNWLILSGYAETIIEAKYVGNELMSHGLLFNAVDEDDHEFEGGNELYQFVPIDGMKTSATDCVDLGEVEALLVRSLKKKDLVIKYMTYRDVFSGSDAVDLLVQKGIVSSRTDAAKVYERLLGDNSITIIQTPNNKLGFFDNVESIYSLRSRNRLGSRIGIGPTPLADASGTIRSNSRPQGERTVSVSEKNRTSSKAGGERSSSKCASPLNLDNEARSASPQRSSRSKSRMMGGGDSEGGGIKTLLNALSPKKHAGVSITSPLQRLTKEGGLLSPRKDSLSHQRAKSKKGAAPE